MSVLRSRRGRAGTFSLGDVGILLLVLLIGLMAWASLGHAQDSGTVVTDSVVVAPEASSPIGIAQSLTMLVLGVLVPVLYRLLEHVAPALRGLTPLAKRSLVALIAGGTGYVLAQLQGYWPWLPIDVSNATAGVAAAIAFALHAGDAAKEAKALGEIRGD